MISIGRIFDKYIAMLTERMLPNKLKRLLFLSTFFAYMQDNDKPDREMVCRINQLLTLTNNENSAMPPNFVQKRIWSKIIPRDEPIGESGLKLCELTEIADIEVYKVQARYITNRIINNIPPSLRYGSNREIGSDLMKLLMYFPKLHQPQ